MPTRVLSLPRVSLKIVRGQARNKIRHITTPAFLVGSASDCDLVLGDTQFPQVYAYLILHSNGVSIRHLGFPPELTVNGQSVTRARLCDDDRLRMGPYEFVVRIQDRCDTPATDRPSFGYLPVNPWADALEESDVDALAAAERLLDDVRRAVGVARRAIPLPAAGREHRSWASDSGLAAS